MRKKRRTFTRADKLRLLREAEGKPMAEVCREYDVDITLLSKWKGEFARNPKEFTGNLDEAAELKKKVAEYERIIGQLCLENIYLKKTSTKFQQLAAEERIKR